MTRREPEVSSKDFERFLSDMVHDLRNLLDGVAMTLPRSTTPSPEVMLQEATFRNVYDVLRKAEDFRARVRPPSPNEGSTEVSPVLERVMKTLQPFLRERNVSVAGTGDAWVATNARALREILENILHVVAKRTGKGDTIRVEVESNDGVRTTCEVPKLAVPTTPDELLPPKLPPETPAFKDGLDLWVSRQRARSHGGDLVCEAHAAGLDIVLTLPKPDSADEGRDSWTRQRVLVVDDNDDSARSLAIILSSAGFETEVCGDGASAEELTSSFRPDALLLDLGLPDIDGYEICRRLRQSHGGQLLILAISGREDDETLSAVEAAGFDDYFLKPVDPKQLIRRLCA